MPDTEVNNNYTFKIEKKKERSIPIKSENKEFEQEWLKNELGNCGYSCWGDGSGF